MILTLSIWLIYLLYHNNIFYKYVKQYIYFPLIFTLSISHKFLTLYFYYISVQYNFNLHHNFFMTYRLFRRLLLNFQLSMTFLVNQIILASNFILLCPDKSLLNFIIFMCWDIFMTQHLIYLWNILGVNKNKSMFHNGWLWDSTNAISFKWKKELFKS